VIDVADNVVNEFENEQKFGTYAENSVKGNFEELNRIFEEKTKK
jgi:hypothetical protein